MLALATLNAILTSTLPNKITTEEPSIFGENGLTLLIIASILILIVLMLLCCFCASHPSGGNGARRIQTILPTRAPTQTTVTQSQSTVYANPTGQPILRTFKSSTHSSSSGESIPAKRPQSNLYPSVASYQNHQQNTNPFFYDVPLDTVSAPRNLTNDYYTRQGLRQYSSDT